MADENTKENNRTINIDRSVDDYSELSEYLEVLSNTLRLKILKILEKGPREIRKIASEIDTSYENTKKHIDKLLSTGLIRKEAGLGEMTSKGVHPVWKYSLVPGAMEAIVRNLGIFSNMRINLVNLDLQNKLAELRGKVAVELTGQTPHIIVLGGADDGKVFQLQGVEMNIGRIDPYKTSSYRIDTDIVLSAEYSAVSRVSKPHAKLLLDGGKWYIEDRESTSGTTVNATPVGKGSKVILNDGDLVELARGPSGANLLVIIPRLE